MEIIKIKIDDLKPYKNNAKLHPEWQIEQIIKSKTYTCIVQKANIQGNIAIIEDCVKNLKMMKLLNLKMEYITRLNSDTMLYKQAGNSIVVNVLEEILKNLLF